MTTYPYPTTMPDECDTDEWEEFPVGAKQEEPAPVEQKEGIDWEAHRRFMKQFR